jgi:hypothetical protein
MASGIDTVLMQETVAVDDGETFDAEGSLETRKAQLPTSFQRLGGKAADCADRLEF